ncbi:MAG TPA: branched-chain amino acid transaminase [Gemmatimonadaceae bacterium]|nr:branched-chain amino acid transaminase [Gemmatimonadaceae bacterium]
MAQQAAGRTAKIWRDGSLVNWEDASIHVLSHVVHYGSSVFEGVRCYETPDGAAVFRLREHMRRLHDSATIYRMPLRWTVDELVQATVDTVAGNDLRECYIRPIVLRTGEQMGFHPIGVPCETFIIAWHWKTYLGDGALENGVDVCVSSWRRPAGSTIPTLAKAGGNYLNSQLAKIEALQDGYAEAIVLDVHGQISEGSGENLFLVRDGALYTPPLASAVLGGITRDSVVRIAKEMGLDVHVQTLPRELLYVADEMFLTGTAAEITPVKSVDRVTVGAGTRGPVTSAIQSRFMDVATGRVRDEWGWLTHVPQRARAGT